MKFATIALIATTSATTIREPWDKDSLPDCPEDKERTVMDDGETHVTKYPFVGATCKLQIGDVNMVMLNGAPAAAPPPPAAPAPPKIPDLSHLEHCPDFNERFTLVNGRTRAIAYPNNGYNCNPEYTLAQGEKPWPQNVNPANINVAAPSVPPAGLEHCPDRPERQTLQNGVTRAVAFPKAGFNCVSDYHYGSFAEKPWPQNVVPPNVGAGKVANGAPAGLEHCPDRPERQTLQNGVTRAVAYPKPGFNCIGDLYYGSLSQQQKPWPQNVVPPNVGAGKVANAAPANLEHCPDRPERQTLQNGVTRAVAYPKPGYNCIGDIHFGSF